MNPLSKTEAVTDTRDSWPALLALSAREVFNLMLASELAAPPENPSEKDLSVTSMVGLAGSMCGLLSVRCDPDAAVLMASKMLGMDAAAVGQEMWDAVGEVCNMVAGNFKNKITGLSDGCQLSVPTVITGEDYDLRTPVNDDAMVVRLLFGKHLLVFSLKLSD